MKKRIVLQLMMLLLVVLLTGCGDGKEEGDYVVYYLNTDVTKLVPVEIELEETTEDARIDKMLEYLQTNPNETGIRQAIPKSIKVLGTSKNSYQLVVDFDESYYQLKPTEEILTRAAIAKTLLQVNELPYVAFTVEGKLLTNKNGYVVGSMGTDSFVENPGQQINSKQQTSLTLYFASPDGQSLVKEQRVVRYTSSISLEKLVMEQLIEGPKSKGIQRTIPAGTKLIKVSVVDGICYVNLDETFMNQNLEISEAVVLYSIVDSLTALINVDKVQISINSDTSGKCRYEYDLSTMYEQDLSLLLSEEATDASTENVTAK